ncbi:hypothetical protein T06_9779, partial [Trichinella sp. T6]
MRRRWAAMERLSISVSSSEASTPAWLRLLDAASLRTSARDSETECMDSFRHASWMRVGVIDGVGGKPFDLRALPGYEVSGCGGCVRAGAPAEPFG